MRVLSKLESLLGSNRQLVNGTTCGSWVCPVHDELELVTVVYISILVPTYKVE